MAHNTFRTQFIDENGQLIAHEVQTTLRRILDMIDAINPPPGSSSPSIIFRGSTTIPQDYIINTAIADNSITTQKLVNEAITAVKLASDAVTEAKIAASAVTIDKVAALVQAALGDTPENLINNGGGEEGVTGEQATGWTHLNGAPALIATDQQKVGARSIKISSVAQNSYSHQSFSIVAGAIYEVSGWVKTDAHAFQAGGSAIINTDPTGSITVIQTDGTGPDIGLPLDGNARDWTLVKCRFLSNANQTVNFYLQVGYGASVTATAWFDGVVVKRLYTIAADDILANAIVAGKIAAGAVTAGTIAALSITAAEIATDAITSAKILAGAVTAAKINVGTLSAISANLGTITAGSIDAVTITSSTISGNTISGGSISGTTITGGTITGTTFMTAGSGNNRVTIDATDGLQLIDSSNVTHVQLNASNYAGIRVGGIRAIDSNDLFLESESQNAQLFVNASNPRISFALSSATRGYFDNNDGNGAGNQPTSLTVRVNGAIRRVNLQAGTGPSLGYLYLS